MIESKKIIINDKLYIKITKNQNNIKLYTLNDSNDTTIIENFNVDSFIINLKNRYKIKNDIIKEVRDF